jgi:hypothetical protein
VEESVPLVLGEREGEELGRYSAGVLYYIFFDNNGLCCIYPLSPQSASIYR